MNLPEREEIAVAQAEPVVEVLARIHAELEEIARRIDHNQSVIAKATWAAGAADEEYVKAMQDADLSAQRVAGVAGFLKALGYASQPHWHIDTAPATGTLKLTELIRSIGCTHAEIQAKNEDDAGDVDFF